MILDNVVFVSNLLLGYWFKLSTLVNKEKKRKVVWFLGILRQSWSMPCQSVSLWELKQNINDSEMTWNQHSDYNLILMSHDIRLIVDVYVTKLFQRNLPHVWNKQGLVLVFLTQYIQKFINLGFLFFLFFFFFFFSLSKKKKERKKTLVVSSSEVKFDW